MSYKVKLTLPVVKNQKAKIEIELDEAGELHIMGETFERNSYGRFEWVSGGQCQDAIAEIYSNFPDVVRLVEIWNRWHLNHLKAGDPTQEAWLRENDHGKDYGETRSKLEAAGLLTHNGYEYGTSWLKEDLPAEIIAEVKQIAARF